MGCIPSKSNSTVHPINSSTDPATIPEQAPVHGIYSLNRTILVQESSIEPPDPPSSTPEPISPEQDFESPLVADLQKKLKNHVKESQHSSHECTLRPRLQRQSTITDGEEDGIVNADGCTNGSHCNMDTSKVENTSNSPVDNLSTRWVSDDNVSNGQCGRPCWSMERACNRSNPTLRLYGTDSQIEFFKMLDKKIEEGPDFFEDSDEPS